MTAPTTDQPVGTEPVMIAHAVTVVLATLVTLGWVSIPSTLIDSIATVAGVALSTAAAWMARSKVVPLAKVATPPAAPPAPAAPTA